MLKIFNWFVKSSVDSKAISLTLKGLVPLLVLLGVDSALAESATSGIVDLIIVLGQLITMATAVYGFTRKIVISLQKK